MSSIAVRSKSILPKDRLAFLSVIDNSDGLRIGLVQHLTLLHGVSFVFRLVPSGFVCANVAKTVLLH